MVDEEVNVIFVWFVTVFLFKCRHRITMYQLCISKLFQEQTCTFNIQYSDFIRVAIGKRVFAKLIEHEIISPT